MTDVFISYSRRNKVFTQKLVDALIKAKREVWADWASIPAASDWEAEIKEGIEKTNTVLFVLSPEWLKSNECRSELIHALRMGKRLVPIMYIMPEQGQEIPPELAKLNWIYMRETDDFDKAFETLLSAMDTDLDWVKLHTRIQVRAVEWNKRNHDNSLTLRGNDLNEGEQFISRATGKSPEPTGLQGEYILVSRKETARRQRLTLIGVTLALVVSVALGIVAFIQRRTAVAAEVESAQQRDLAVSAEAVAVTARETAVANEQLAIANEQVAIRNGLVAETEMLISRDFHKALLLGIETFRFEDNLDTRAALLDSAAANPGIIQYLDGHTDSVKSVAFSLDGKTLASGSKDNTIILWDVATGTPIGQPLTGHTDTVNSVAFSPDGKMLASGSADNTIILWEVATGEPIGQPLVGHTDWVNSVAFSPDGKILASGSDDKTIILWDVATGAPIGQPLQHGDRVLSLSFWDTYDEWRFKTWILASGGADGAIIVWNVTSGRSIMELRDTSGGNAPSGVTSVVIEGGGADSLVAGYEDGHVRVWNWVAVPPALISDRLLHTSGVNSVATPSTMNAWTASGGSDKTIVFYDWWSDSKIDWLPDPILGGPVYSLAFSPDGKTLAVGTYDQRVLLLSTEKSSPIGQSIEGSITWDTYSMTLSPDGMTLAAGYSDYIILWDVVTRTPIGEPLTKQMVVGTVGDVWFNPDGNIVSLAFSPDGKTLASGNEDTSLILWDVATGERIDLPFVGHTGSVNSLAYSPDGTILASGSSDTTIILWDVATGTPIGQPLTGHMYDVNSVAFSPDGKTLASGSGDYTIILWDVATGTPIGEPLLGHTNAVNSVAFSPDGTILASGSTDNTIILWDVATRTPIGLPLTGHTDRVDSVAFSPDGKTLASSSEDMIILWDVATRTPIGRPIKAIAAYLGRGMEFSPDGKTLAATADENIILLNLDENYWIERSCQRAGRNLTQAEWTDYFPNTPYRKTCEQWPAGQ